MRKLLIVILAAFLLAGQAFAAEVPEDLTDALPEQTEDFLRDGEFSTAEGFAEAVENLLQQTAGQAGKILRQRLRGAAAVLLAVVLCSMVEGFRQGIGGKSVPDLLPLVGAFTVTLLAAGDMEILMGLGRQTIEDLALFSRVLLPTLAAATAAAGGISAATAQKVTAVLLVELLITLIRRLLLPLLYLYIGVLTAACALPENRLEALAAGLKKTVTWCLTTALLCFTLYLSLVRVVTGAVDAVSVRVAKAAISGVVPVVGGIISEAAETVLAGAGVLKNTVGIFGTVAVLAICLLPFLHLGIQYLLYKMTAFFAAAMGVPKLCKLIDGLGGAFGLLLGMTGSCALLLLISVLSSVAAVVP